MRTPILTFSPIRRALYKELQDYVRMRPHVRINRCTQELRPRMGSAERSERKGRLMTNPNGVRQAAIVACRDSLAATKEVTRRCGVDADDLLILSRADDPELRTIDDILGALPSSIRLLSLDD